MLMNVIIVIIIVLPAQAAPIRLCEQERNC